MKIIKLILPVFFLALLSCNTIQNSEIENTLLKLLNEDRLFELRDAYEGNSERISQKTNLLIQAKLLNTFNKNRQSNEAIESLFEKFKGELPDSSLVKLYNIKADNYLKLFDYKNGFETNNLLINEFQGILDSIEYENALNMRSIYEPLMNVPPQQVLISEDMYIPLSRDIAGLMNVNVEVDQKDYSFIFDTGAGMSVIKKSFAKSMGMEILETSIDVNTATGNVIKSALAVADTLIIGNILVKNVVFLAMEDELLEFPQIDYFPLGAIGFPVIEEFKEITITKNDTLIVWKNASSSNISNLRLDELQPLLYLFNGKDTLEYSFDTGATKSHFTSKYYEKYREDFPENISPDTISTGSAGGQKQQLAYLLESIELQTGSVSSKLKDIYVHVEFSETFKNVYGNLGQDMIRQHESFTLNFENMFLKFE